MSHAPTILVFDSGLGGLTVFRETKTARTDACFVYLADDAEFPYGDLAEEKLVDRVTEVLAEAIARHKPDLVVVACNTASTLALSQLRSRFAVPFVGTVPAIKPACAQSKSKRVTVLGTQATVGREYTRALIREFASGCDVHLVGSPRLAQVRGSRTRRCGGRRRCHKRRDGGLLHRRRRAPYRHDRARLYALSVAARTLPHRCTVDCRLARPSTGNRPSGR